MAHAKKTYEETQSQKQRREGRPMNNLEDVIKEDLEKKGCTKEDAEDRKEWKEAKEGSPRRTG